MTIASIIQSFALGFLLASVGDSHSHALTASPGALIAWLQAAAVLHLICITWHINAINSVLFFYVFGLSDSVIPFLLGIAEFFLIKTIGASSLDWWLCAMAGFSASAFWAYMDMFRKVRRDPLNIPVLKAMGRYPVLVQSYVACSSGLFFLFGLVAHFGRRRQGGELLFLVLVNINNIAFTILEVRMRGRLFAVNPGIPEGSV